ncbi:hypothetical protein ACTXT7_015723 [Hymenolepis weldensis]
MAYWYARHKRVDLSIVPRLPYLIVNIMFYIIRFVLAIWFMVISYSYILELRQELYTPVDPEARPEIEQASVMPSLLASRQGIVTSNRHL